jgi:hypothetical protein
MSVIDVFPKRPMQVTAYYQRTTVWGLIVAVAAIGFFGYSSLKSTASLLDDYKLKDGGTVALRSHLTDGECRMWLLNDCDFDANYQTADGTSYKKHVEMTTIFSDPDQQMRFVVKYDPKSPESISTSWGVGLLVNRTITAFLSWMVLLSMIPYAIWTLLQPGKLKRKLAAIGAQPTPVDVKFLKAFAAPRKPVATISYSWVDAMGVEKKASNEFRGVREPFWLDAGKTRMLALVSPDGQAQLLDEKLAQVNLTDQERTQVMYERDRTIQAAAPAAPAVSGYRPAM